MMVQRRRIQFWLFEVFLVCFCGILAGQEKEFVNGWAEILSMSIELTTEKFIQISGINPISVPGEIGRDSGVIESADILKDHDTYYFYYHAVGEKDKCQLGVVTADHPLRPWKKYEKNPILEVGPEGSWDDGVYSEAGPKYHEGMFHLVNGGTKRLKLECLGYSYSFNGINWKKCAANPVVSLGKVPDGSGFAEVHRIEGPYIYIFYTLRYNTGEGIARELSIYAPLKEQDYGKEALTDHILYHNKNYYSGRWVTEYLAIQVLTIDPQFKIAFPVLHNILLNPNHGSRLAECLPIGLEAVSGLAISAECT